MTEQSGKTSARQDDRLAHETEGLVQGGHSTHAQEWADPQPSGEDQPDVDLVPDGEATGPAMDMSEADVAGRSDLARHLGITAFPGDRDQLLDAAQQNAAPDAVLAQLRRLPAGRQYDNVNAVWVELGGSVEEHRA